MRGFKEDFYEWKSTLTSDEREMLMKQRRGEFDKKYRKTEEFDKDLPQEKIEAFGKVLQKFFDSEEEDYVKQRDAKAPDYDRLAKKCAVKAYDWSLTNKVIEIDRDAQRMEEHHHTRIRQAKQKGEKEPSGSMIHEVWPMKNDDEASHKANVAVLEKFSKLDFKDLPKETQESLDWFIKQGVPPMGQPWKFLVPEFLMKQWLIVNDMYNAYLKEHPSEKKEIQKSRAAMIEKLTNIWLDEAATLYEYANDLKEIAKSQTYVEGKTRSQWAKELHEAIAKYNKENKLEPPPPLDEEYLAELDKEPCMKPDHPHFRSPWTTASKVYKSEAYDSFGRKFLLGVFPTIDEARATFKDWSNQYEEGRAKLKEECLQWGKQEQARLDKDPESQARMKKAVEDARR